MNHSNQSRAGPDLGPMISQTPYPPGANGERTPGDGEDIEKNRTKTVCGFCMFDTIWGQYESGQEILKSSISACPMVVPDETGNEGRYWVGT